MTRRWLAVVGAAVLAVATNGCSLVPSACDVTIAGVPDTAVDGVGKPLPADALILARPADIDPSRGHLLVDVNGTGSVVLQLRPEAAQRLKTHTTANTGHFLAIAVGNEVVAVPAIMASIDNGDLQLSGAADGPALPEVLAGCATGTAPAE